MFQFRELGYCEAWSDADVMRRGRIVWVTIGCAAVAAVTWCVLWPRESEPEYNGRKLSEWLAKADPGVAPDAGTTEAEGAVRAIGTNAIRLLLRWISYEPSAVRAGTYALVCRFHKNGVPWALLSGPLALLKNKQAEERARRATRGFFVLGQKEESAVPRLGELALASSCPESSRRAILALGWTGQSGRAVLEKVSGDSTHPWKGVAAGSLDAIPNKSLRNLEPGQF